MRSSPAIFSSLSSSSTDPNQRSRSQTGIPTRSETGFPEKSTETATPLSLAPPQVPHGTVLMYLSSFSRSSSERVSLYHSVRTPTTPSNAASYLLVPLFPLFSNSISSPPVPRIIFSLCLRGSSENGTSRLNP